jgi:hypothetical protein
MEKRYLVKNRENGKFSFILLGLFLFTRTLPPFSSLINSIPIMVILFLNLGLLSMEININKNVNSLRVYVLLTLPTFLWVGVTYGFIDLSFLPDLFYVVFLNIYCRFILCYYFSFLICSFELRLLSRLHAQTLRFRLTYFLMKFLVRATTFLSKKLWRKCLSFITLCFFYLLALYTGNSIVLCLFFFIVYTYTYCSFVVIHFTSTEKLNRITYNKKLDRYFPL